MVCLATPSTAIRRVRKAARFSAWAANATTPALKARLVEKAQRHERIASGIEPATAKPIQYRGAVDLSEADAIELFVPRFQCAFCNAINDVARDDYIQVTFAVSSGVRDIIFRHPEMLSVEDFYLRYNFSKGFIAPHGMTHQQLVAALSRGFADIEGHEHRSFDFEVTAGRF
jgi:hypothetical protein